jgi:hypothetical protein
MKYEYARTENHLIQQIWSVDEKVWVGPGQTINSHLGKRPLHDVVHSKVKSTRDGIVGFEQPNMTKLAEQLNQ